MYGEFQEGPQLVPHDAEKEAFENEVFVNEVFAFRMCHKQCFSNELSLAK